MLMFVAAGIQAVDFERHWQMSGPLRTNLSTLTWPLLGFGLMPWFSDRVRGCFVAATAVVVGLRILLLVFN
jgi:hypothetical protein